MATFFGAAALAGAFGGMFRLILTAGHRGHADRSSSRYTSVCDWQDGWHRWKKRLGLVCRTLSTPRLSGQLTVEWPGYSS